MRNMLTQLAFIDETSLKTNMVKTTGWAPCGARLVDHAPFGHWQTQTFIAALRHDRLDAPWVIGGAIYREFFDLYIETQLAPTLQKGDVVILDNLATHKSPKAAAILKDSKRCVRPVVSAFRIFGQATLRMMFAGGTLWSTKMSTGWRFPVEGECRGSRFWMGRLDGDNGRTI